MSAPNIQWVMSCSRSALSEATLSRDYWQVYFVSCTFKYKAKPTFLVAIAVCLLERGLSFSKISLLCLRGCEK